MPHITDGTLDADADDDVPVLTRPQGYVGDQSALVAAITAELTSKGVALAAINQYLPQIEQTALGLLSLFAPAAVPVANAVINVLPKIALVLGLVLLSGCGSDGRQDFSAVSTSSAPACANGQCKAK